MNARPPAKQEVSSAAKIGLLAVCVLLGLGHERDSLGQTPDRKPGGPSVAGEQLPKEDRPIGTGLREQTAPIILKYKDNPGMVMSASTELAAQTFPKLKGWIRVLGAPSLDGLRGKAQADVPYEALGYGLETGRSTPQDEWHDLVGATRKARDICDQAGKLLVMGPGFRLMSENTDKYAPMSALSHIWVFQTQRFQLDPPGETYRRNVASVVEMIKAGNPDIKIWAQICLPPDRKPDAEEWLAYRQSIVDLVDGTYVGAYTWRTEAERLPGVIETIFASIYGDPKTKKE